MTAVTLDAARELLAEPNLIAVGVRGDDERRRRHGARTTFVRVFKIHTEIVPTALPASAEPGEIRLISTPPTIAAALDAVKAARALAGATPVTAYALSDLFELAGGTYPALTDLAGRLASAGLAMVAEAPIDRLADPVAAVRAAREGGLQVPRLTVEQNTDRPRIELASLAREIQSAAGGVRAFAPLPRVSPVAHPSTGYDDVKLIAIARLLADNIDSIQVDWSLHGPKLAQVALTMGADDVDDVSALPGDLGRRRSPLEEIRTNITAAGLDPVERNGLFDADGQ